MMGNSVRTAILVLGLALSSVTVLRPAFGQSADLNDRDLKAPQADAREHHRGLWSTVYPMPPWVWRKLNSPAPVRRTSGKRSEPRSHRRSNR